ncbi:MAG: TPM domain-containing protein [Geobacter sp.]|nr:TPM domain-containing protein [Geobacter sp.]
MESEKARDFFTPDERDRISLAVMAAERTTSGEIATMVVDESDGYPEAATLGAILTAALVGCIVSILIQHVTIWSYVPLVCVLYFPARLLFTAFPGVKLSFAGRRRVEEAVRERAVRAFYEKGLYKTREETGILIFLSLLEHKVWILGDRGINEKIPAGSWQTLASELAAGIREGRACDALVDIIGRCGAVLSENFPIREDDKDELSNELLG